jgi:hypothetical protein
VRARRHFGEICHLHFQGRKGKEEEMKEEKEKWEDEKEKGKRNWQSLEFCLLDLLFTSAAICSSKTSADFHRDYTALLIRRRFFYL